MQNAKNWLYSSEGSLFNQIAMFSVAGLLFSMTMVFVGDFQVQSYWI
jgi:hypothetical protein